MSDAKAQELAESVAEYIVTGHQTAAESERMERAVVAVLGQDRLDEIARECSEGMTRVFAMLDKVVR